MKYPKLVQELGLELICVSVSVADHLRYYRGNSEAEIKKELLWRGQDKSFGSTYVIDLGEDVCYRFGNHGGLISDWKFLGFKNIDTSKCLDNGVNSEFLAVNLSEFYISEGFVFEDDSTEMHKSTAIAVCYAIPVRVAALAIKQESAEYLRELERIFFGNTQIPLPGEAVNFSGRKSFILKLG